ncbi:DUF6214 family protein [Streptomyces sp. NBC_01716]|uniref:DUF6214 family protein n=1 Tax=Streptomyces sp. NBC_01716 TaxID=2975917 RepID=UPI002E3405BF|nr:DUF6214 family protein [Streptomyces sp. NBC_01716]
MTSAAEPATPVWPRWEVQGYGTVTCDTLPGGRCELPRHELVPPWVDIRLTFADGARVDVLAVLRDGVVAVEDAQADPPLPLDDLTELRAWIEAPVEYACRVVAGQHHVEAGPVEGDVAAARPAPKPAVRPASSTAEPAVAVTAEGEGYEYEGGPSGADAELLEDEPAPGGRHRADDSVSSDRADRRGVAETYRRAQQLGQDPVLAVMCATGYGRRKSLSVIASARDDGYLTPRHRRR